MSASDSDSDENEDMSKLLSAVDTNFMSDKMFKEKPHSNGKNDPKPLTDDKPKSQRYLDNTDPIFQSELNVNESMQKHFRKKLSAAIEKQVDFIDDHPATNEPSNDLKFPKLKSIRLVTDSDVLKPKAILNVAEENPNVGRKKLEVKRRKVSELNGVLEEDKVVESCIKIDDLLNETKAWKGKKNSKVFQYRTKKGVSYLVEPDTEFTKLRKKNNWDEGKISTVKWNKST